jgi:hypothetical protein
MLAVDIALGHQSSTSWASWTWLVATVVASGVSVLTAVLLAWTLANVWVLAVGGPQDLLGLVGR